MGFLLMLGRRMRLRPKAETGLLLLLHEWTVNTQNTSTLLTQAQRQRGSRRPASWIPRVDRARKHLTWAPVSLRKCSSSLLGWCERKWREEPQTLLQCQLPSAGSEQQPGGRSNMHPALPPPQCLPGLWPSVVPHRVPLAPCQLLWCPILPGICVKEIFMVMAISIFFFLLC